MYDAGPSGDCKFLHVDPGLLHCVGLKPKTFHRVERLRRVLHYLHAESPLSLTRIGYACGYVDQAHMINDFRSLAGITPGEYALAHNSVGRGVVPHRLVSES